MSSRDSFWFLAGALVAAAVLLAARAAWSRKTSTPHSGPVLPAIAIAALSGVSLLVATLGIYLLLGRSEPRAGSPVQATGARQAGSLEEVTQRLAARLSANGGSDEEWKLLSQSYEFLGRAEDAKRALAHIGGGRSADLASVAAALDGFRGAQ